MAGIRDRAQRVGYDIVPTAVAGVTLRHLPIVDDIRGLLSFGEIGQHVPFGVKRYFLVYGVSDQEIRGDHAHKTLHQFLICVHGSCQVSADDGTAREEFVLDRPSLGIYLPPMTWGAQYNYSPDAVLLTLGSEHYDAADYIRSYVDFLARRRSAS
jgi:UDP-2-acetamido-3-amino-2,3-dideoxy-glucuronate N-acetyltransferase